VANTDSLLTFSLAVRDKIEDNLAALGIVDVYFGDQNKIPRVPAACVEPVDKTRELAGVPRRTDNELQVYILETLLHADAQFGGLVIHSLVTSIESGYSHRTGTLYRSSRLTFVGTTKTNLPYSAA